MALTDALYSLFSYFVQWHRDNYQTLHGKGTVDTVYPIGSIYITVDSRGPENLFPGTTWEQLTDTFLYASTTADNNAKSAVAGSKDAVAVDHYHWQDSHNHGQDPHSHWQDAHSHNARSISNDPNYTYYFLTTGVEKGQEPAVDWKEYGVKSGTFDNSVKKPWLVGNKDPKKNAYISQPRATATAQPGIYNSTINIWHAQPVIHNSDNVVSGIDKNMPPYMKVYMWKRTG